MDEVPDMPDEEWREVGGRARWVQSGAVRLRCWVAGAAEGKAVVLLHGFPDGVRVWRRQVGALLAEGFRVVGVEMRGYGGSDVPRGVGEYSGAKLVGDGVAVIDQVCGERACVVGHDWGGIVAWYLAMRHPERVERMVVINAPHPGAYRRELWKGGQVVRSWYAAAFQVPGVAERVLAWGDFRLARRVVRRGPARFAEDVEGEVGRYVEEMRGEGKLAGMINYYRGAGREILRGRGEERVRVPVMVLWGEGDRFLGRGLLRGLEGCVPGVRVERHGRAGHWVLLEEAGWVNDMVVGFLREPLDGRAGETPASRADVG